MKKNYNAIMVITMYINRVEYQNCDYNPLYVEYQDGSNWQFEYNEQGEVIHEKSSSGYEVWKEYDNQGNLIRSRNVYDLDI